MFKIGLRKILLLKKFKILFRGYLVLVISQVKKLLNVLRKRIVKSKSKGIQDRKRIKTQGDKVYVKWIGYNSFNSWIDKEDTVIEKYTFHLMVIVKTKQELYQIFSNHATNLT